MKLNIQQHYESPVSIFCNFGILDEKLEIYFRVKIKNRIKFIDT